MVRWGKGPAHPPDFDRKFWKRTAASAIMRPPGKWCWTCTPLREKIPVNSNFRDLLSAFNRYHVRYLIVGAYAAMRYTEPRYTEDLDMSVDPVPQNAERVFRALAEFGARLKGHGPEDFTAPYIWFQIGREPQSIDVLTSIEGVQFSRAWDKRATSRVDGMASSMTSTPAI
jgi:hypothetical protein